MTVDPSDDDDRLREALRRDAPPPEAAVVLHQLQPRMRRSRSHRRIAKGTATALLVVSAAAAVLAVNASIPGPERRALTTLPSVTGPDSDESTSTAAVTTDRLVPAPTSPGSPDDPTESIEPDTTAAAVGVPTETTATLPAVTPAPGAVAQPVPTAAPPPPPPPAPVEGVTVAPTTSTAPPAPTAPAPPAPSTRKVDSMCGVVVIGIDGQRIHVDSIAPSPGFTSQVATDGPETVELVLVSSGEKCEIHVESTADGLHVEAQDNS